MNATHWTSELVYATQVAIPIGDELVEIGVDAEVPMAGDKRLERRGNRYFPTLVDVEIYRTSDGLQVWNLSLHAETARELGQALIAAADTSDAIDTPDTDTCGHWAPCDCVKANR